MQLNWKRAFVVCGQAAAGNRLVEAVLCRGGALASAGDDFPAGPDTHPCVCLTCAPVMPHLSMIHSTLLRRGYSPYYIYVVRERAAQIASITRRQGPIGRADFDITTRHAMLQLVREGADFEIYPIEALMLGGDRAAATLCGRLGLNAAVSSPLSCGEGILDSDSKYWRLDWRVDHGFYPVENSAAPYNDAYFDKYAAYSVTEQGAVLTGLRADLVSAHWGGPVLDFGIGSGHFLDAYGNSSTGFDINPKAVAWLSSRGLWQAPWPPAPPVDAITFWDSLEHIEDWRPLVERVRKYVFISTPIFSCSADVFASHHFRIDEHFWYFTRGGIERLMGDLGFKLIHFDNKETTLGRRHGIESFVFTRASE